MSRRRRIGTIVFIIHATAMILCSIPTDVFVGPLIHLHKWPRHLYINMATIPSSVELFKYGRSYSEYFVKAHCIEMTGRTKTKAVPLQLYDFRCPKRIKGYQFRDQHRTVFYYIYNILFNKAVSGKNFSYYMVRGKPENAWRNTIDAFLLPFCRDYNFEKIDFTLIRKLKSYTGDGEKTEIVHTEQRSCLDFRGLAKEKDEIESSDL